MEGLSKDWKEIEVSFFFLLCKSICSGCNWRTYLTLCKTKSAINNISTWNAMKISVEVSCQITRNTWTELKWNAVQIQSTWPIQQEGNRLLRLHGFSPRWWIYPRDAVVFPSHKWNIWHISNLGEAPATVQHLSRFNCSWFDLGLLSKALKS